MNDNLITFDPPIVVTPPVVITFDPPITVNPNAIPGDMIVTTAEVIPQDDSTQVIASIFGDGRVIGVPFINDPKNSLIVALSN